MNAQTDKPPLKPTKLPVSLLLDRCPQHDLFICDVTDVVPKDMMAHMEHPFYSLSKRLETSVRRYEHNGNWIEITPSIRGLATMYDKDILIYCISQIMAKLKSDKPVSSHVRINSRDFLIFTNRGTSGKDYLALIEAINRLAGTRISTNIRTADEERYDTFGLIDAASIRRKHGFDGRLLWCEIKLSDWIFNAICSQEVLTLHRDYFQLRKPIERRIYELARKHCGQQEEWQISLSVLLKKTGSQSPLKRFRQMIHHLVKYNHLPDYSVFFNIKADIITFHNRGTMLTTAPNIIPWNGWLDPNIYNNARLAAPRWDIHMLEEQWRIWLSEYEIEPQYPAYHFIKFCRSWFNKRGYP